MPQSGILAVTISSMPRPQVYPQLHRSQKGVETEGKEGFDRIEVPCASHGPEYTPISESNHGIYGIS